MRDRLGGVLYVGKASSLRSRVSSYFSSPSGLQPKIRNMVRKVADFDFITTESEQEALILECNLIKQHKPHYNARLKDDKSYPFIKIDVSEDFPLVYITRRVAKDGARLTLSDIHEDRAAALAAELGAETAAPDAVMSIACDVFSPNALGAVLDDEGIARLDCQIVAGGANNQLKRPEHGPMLAQRGILYAPDYVINAGGIISVTLEYLCRRDNAPCDINEVRKRIALIPGRLEQIWRQSDETGVSPDQVADRMAQELIGR